MYTFAFFTSVSVPMDATPAAVAKPTDRISRTCLPNDTTNRFICTISPIMFSLKRCKLPNKSLRCFCSPTLRILFACLLSVIQYLVDSIESVQRRFTKYLPGFSSVSYSERLKRLKFDNLELRRLYIDLILCFTSVMAMLH